MLRTAIIIPVLLCIAVTAAAQKKPLPRFKDYPVQEKFPGKPAKPKLTSERARLFRTNIRMQTAQGPNFAGHYRIATWGCGTWCIQFAIIDCETGEVYFPSQVETVGGIVPLGNDDKLLEYRVDSRLLVVAGAVDDFHGRRSEGKFFYEWKNDHLVLIRRVNLPKS